MAFIIPSLLFVQRRQQCLCGFKEKKHCPSLVCSRVAYEVSTHTQDVCHRRARRSLSGFVEAFMEVFFLSMRALSYTDVRAQHTELYAKKFDYDFI
jgi:hypothetical protein